MILVLVPVRGTLVELMLREYGGDAVLRVASNELAPEFVEGDYVGVCLPMNRPPRPGDAVVVTLGDDPEPARPQFTLRLYDEFAGEPALLPVLRDSDDDLLMDGAAIWAVAVWLYRDTAAAAQQPPSAIEVREEASAPAA